ncbi:MAG TPA: glycosyltransferase family 39 protein [Vicinamibacterales bacterium]|nr:glycosyltransferase family 39 protein [Vicinamibacterales bacterium]
MTRRAFVAGLLAALVVGTVLRTLWLRADPPTSGVGIVWHDEGAWVHNARNGALWDVWRTDEWNPVFIAPVFTALEYAAFEAFGVGTWQARVVPVLSGLGAMAMLIAGLHALAGRRAALIGAVLIATNYVFVMWNRAALLESTMIAFIVASWGLYAMSERRPVLGAFAGAAAVLAWFSKAAAAFFIAALLLDVVWTLWQTRATRSADWSPNLRGADLEPSPPYARRAALWTLAGMALTAALIALAFVLPNWTEYQFYNWQMTVARKPSYALADIITRASWLPVVHGIFSRTLLVVAGGSIAIMSIVLGWRTAKPAERLLVLWVLVGFLELVAHDSGSERRYVMFIPAFVALAAMLAGSGQTLLPSAVPSRDIRWAAWPVFLLLSFVVAGSWVRLFYLDEIAAGNFKATVRYSAAIAVVWAVSAMFRWQKIHQMASRQRLAPALVGVLLSIAVGFNLIEYGQWAARAGEYNYRASVDVGGLVASGTLVQGKLANGLSLDNRIRPIFIGNGFGNYADRLQRDDVRYILTYTLPRVGYESGHEGRLITELLARYPKRHDVASFEVDETPALDRATLIDKFPSARD